MVFTQVAADLLVQLADLKLKRYIAYNVKSLADYGLDKPARSIAVVTSEGKAQKLLVSDRPCPSYSYMNVYAMIEGTRNVFIVTPESVSHFDFSLSHFEKAPDS